MFLVRFTELSQAERALQESVIIGYCKVTPRLWIERSKNSMSHRPCRNCCLLGHVASRCRAAVVCSRCGGDHRSDTCESDSRTCVNCDTIGDHNAGSYSCPYYLSWARRALCDKVGLKKTLWPEEFVPARVNRVPRRKANIVRAPPRPVAGQKRDRPVRKDGFPALQSPMVRTSDFQKAMNELRDKMEKSAASVRESLWKEMDARIDTALSKAVEDISAQLIERVSQQVMDQVNFVVQRALETSSEEQLSRIESRAESCC